MSSKYVKVNGFKCCKCGGVVISLHRHDMRSCACGNFVDGGFDYVRRGGKFEDMEEIPLYYKKEPK